MPKRELSTRDGLSSIPSSSQSEEQLRFQLLHGLPASLLSSVCSFLSVYQVVCILRSTCRTLQDGVTADCLLRHHLTIMSRSLPALVASQPSTRALVRRIPSLSIRYQYEEGECNKPIALLPLHALRCPLDASRFLFSSLSSLHVSIGEKEPSAPCPTPASQSFLLSLLLLLADSPDSFSSLRCLHIEEQCYAPLEEAVTNAVKLPCSSLARLPALTHCRIRLERSSALSCSSLVSALSSMASLTCLDLAGNIEVWPELLPLLSADAAAPLLLRLQTLKLPDWCAGDGIVNGLHDALLRRLSSLPEPPALQHFSAVPSVRHRAAGLMSVFSLPHLRRLHLGGSWVRAELFALVSSFTSAPAPLVSLVLPALEDEPNYVSKDEAAQHEEAAVVSRAVQLLLSRFTALRELTCNAAMISGASKGADGCSASLYRLRLDDDRPLRLRFAAPMPFPLLTELTVDLPMADAELELLLSGCPQLLVLSCTVWYSWQPAVCIAARCCPRLLDLTVTVKRHPEKPHADAVARPESNPSAACLPDLIALTLYGPGCDASSVLQHFTAPPHAQLRYVWLEGRHLTAQHVMSLHCLPRLSYLHAQRNCLQGGSIAEVLEAGSRARQQLLSRGAVGDADRDLHEPMALRETCDDVVAAQLLGPHQQQQMKERVLQEVADLDNDSNLLASVEGVPRDTVRAVFFAKLQSVLAMAAPAGEGEEKSGAEHSLSRQ